MKVVKAQEENYLKAIQHYLAKKEFEMKEVLRLLEKKYGTSDAKDEIIAKLQNLVGKLEFEGTDVL